MVFLYDIVYTYYLLKISEGKALLAAIFGSITYLFSACIISAYIDNVNYLISVVLGSFVGTYWIVWWNSLKEEYKHDIFKKIKESFYGFYKRIARKKY